MCALAVQDRGAPGSKRVGVGARINLLAHEITHVNNRHGERKAVHFTAARRRPLRRPGRGLESPVFGARLVRAAFIFQAAGALIENA
jgi:hypothetical protein